MLNLGQWIFFQTLVILAFPRLSHLLILCPPPVYYILLGIWRMSVDVIHSRSLEVTLRISLKLHCVILLGRYRKQKGGRKLQKSGPSRRSIQFSVPVTQHSFSASLYESIAPLLSDAFIILSTRISPDRKIVSMVLPLISIIGCLYVCFSIPSGSGVTS